MTTIYLFRHGQYETHDGILPYRLPNFHLSQKGIDDVTAVAQKIADRPIVAVYTSPLERTFETATILAKPFGLTPIVDERLLEVRSPVQGNSEDFLTSKGGWEIYDSKWFKENGGEPIVEIAARMKSAVEEFAFKHEGKEIIVVSHGDPLMILKAIYLEVSLTPTELSQIPYISMAGGYRVGIDENGIALVLS